MTIVVTELQGSRRYTKSRDGKSSTLDLSLNIAGTDSEFDATAAAETLAPLVWGVTSPILWRQSITVTPQEIDGSNSRWLAEVHYDTTSPESPSDDDSIEFDTSGGTQHITQSLATIASYPNGAPDHQGAIAVSSSGVEGADIVVPSLQFSITKYFAQVSTAYVQLLGSMTGSINAGSFKGFAPGEVLFEGANGQKEPNQSETPWRITYRFRVSANQAAFSVGSISVTGGKYGHDLMWVSYQEAADESAVALVKRPRAVYIERVYPVANFGLLGV